jgi:hypothetical protein
MSLFDKMIPEVKQKLLADKEEYPNLHESIMADINKSQLISDLSVHTATNLVQYLPFTERSNSFVVQLYKVFGQ